MLIVDVQHPDSLDRKIRVGVMGSCRARDMLVNIYKSEEAESSKGNSLPCETVTYNFGIFTHTPSQAIQYYKFLRSREEIMEELQPLFFWKPLVEAEKQLNVYTQELLDSIDIMVVEARKFVKLGGKPLLKWWRSVSQGVGEVSQEIVEETLAALPSKDIPDNENIRFIIKNLRKRIESKQEFSSSLEELIEVVNVPVIVLPHFDIPDSPIVGRHKLRQYIDELSKDIGYHVYDTTPLIAEYGREASLAGGGTSVNHYSHSFHHTLLNNFRPFLHEVYDEVKNHAQTKVSLTN